MCVREHETPALLRESSTARLIPVARDAGLLSPQQADDLAAAYATLLERALACTLDARPRIAARDAALDAATAAVLAVAQSLDLRFLTSG